MTPVQAAKALERVLAYYRDALTREPAAQEYLQCERGVSSRAAKMFEIGYAPGGLGRLMTETGLSLDTLEATGVVAQGKDGRPYPVFRRRLVFPIRDAQGQLRGFGGRLLPDGRNDGKAPKYLNTPETPFFQKGRLLYGEDKAFSPTAGGVLYLVEGYMDVVSLWDRGLEGAIAGMGTALSEEQACRLRDAGKRIVQIYDGDAAGQVAAIRNLETLVCVGVPLSRIRLHLLPDAEDPDSWVRKVEPAAARAILDTAPFAIEFVRQRLMARRAQNEPLAARSYVAENLLSWVPCITQPAERDALVSVVADYLEVRKERLAGWIRQRSPKRTVVPAPGT